MILSVVFMDGYVCRYEHARAWQCLMERITGPKVALCLMDAPWTLPKKLHKVWPHSSHLGYLFHIFLCPTGLDDIRQVDPKTLAERIFILLLKIYLM